MKLLFIGCTPSPNFQKALEHHKLPARFAEDVPSSAQTPAEILVWKIPSIEKLSELASLRLSHPDAWIALVVSEAWLAEPTPYSALLAAKDKDDVWLEGSWESGFWLGIQRAVQNRASKNREQTLQKELESIKTEQEKLVEVSSALVQRLEEDVNAATEVHRKFYPRFSPDVPGVHVLSKYLPASGKGGDYFDLFEFGDKRRFGVLLADSDSHRAAASLLSVLLRVRLDELKKKFPDSNSFVEHLSEAVRAEQPASENYLNLLYGVFDRATLQLELTVAGDFAPRLWRQGKWHTIAIRENASLLQGTQWKATPVALQAGDTLLVFSNGLTAALSSEEGGIEKTLERLQKSKDPLDLRNRLLAEVESAKSRNALPDDVTFILLAVDPGATHLRPITQLRAVK